MKVEIKGPVWAGYWLAVGVAAALATGFLLDDLAGQLLGSNAKAEKRCAERGGTAVYSVIGSRLELRRCVVVNPGVSK